MALPPTPAITWYTAFARTVTCPGPVDSPLAKPVVQGAVVESGSGIRDKWVKREDSELYVIHRYIPKLLSGSITGWSDATTGWYQFLLWADKQNPFRYMPDASSMGSYHTCYLLEWEDSRDDGGAHRKLTMKMRDTTATQFTEY